MHFIPNHFTRSAQRHSLLAIVVVPSLLQESVVVVVVVVGSGHVVVVDVVVDVCEDGVAVDGVAGVAPALQVAVEERLAPVGQLGQKR